MSQKVLNMAGSRQSTAKISRLTYFGPPRIEVNMNKVVIQIFFEVVQLQKITYLSTTVLKMSVVKCPAFNISVI